MLALKAATVDEHARVEAAFDLSWVCSDLGHYRSTLTVFLSALDSLKKIRAQYSSSEALEFEPSRSVELIHADLSDLQSGCSTEPLELGISTPCGFLGAMYVVEGSALGGLIIAKALRQGFGEDVPLRFFGGFGKQAASVWREFGRRLDNHVRQHGCLEEVISGAKILFEALEFELSKRRCVHA